MPYVTSVAGMRAMAPASGNAALTPWVGLAVFCLWVAAALTAALVLLRRRDA
jgi:ABC-2 type transport system permease protein